MVATLTRTHALQHSSQNFEYFLDRIIHWLFLFYILVLFIDGYATEKLGINRIETIYYACVISLLSVRFIFIPINRGLLLLLTLFVVVVLAGILITESNANRLFGDLRFLLRSFLIGSLVFWFYSSTKWISYRNINQVYTVYWICITVFILLHVLFGIGGVTRVTGVVKNIFTSYFQEGNVVAFIYMMAWFNLYLMLHGRLIKFALTIVALFVSFLMSSKALTLMMLMLLVLSWIWRFERISFTNKVFIRSLLLFFISFVLLFWSYLAEWVLRLFAEVSPDGAVILSRLNSQDILTVLLSTRDLKIIALLDFMHHYDWITWWFGLGSSELIEGDLLVESDFFDILKFFGIAGLILYVFAAVAIWRLIISQHQLKLYAYNNYLLVRGMFIATIVVSSMTGHILISPGAMIVIGLLFGSIASHKIKREMINYSCYENWRYKKAL